MLISAVLLLVLIATATATTVVAVEGPGSEKIWLDNQCPNIGNQVYENLQICLKKCEDNPRCTAVNACPEGKNQRCIQRGCSLPVPTPTGTFSTCRGHVVKEQCQVEMDVDYPGNNINNGHQNQASSYQECRTLCEETLGCKAFSWSNGGAQAGCWLKSKISGSSPSTGSVSGKACKIKTCLPEKGVEYVGNDINPDSSTMWDKTETHEECKTLCEETSGCNFYTWKQNQGCWLKSMRSSTRRYGSKFISGFPCTTCTTTPDTTFMTQGSCKAPNVMDSQTFNKLKQKYMKLDKNNGRNFRKEAEELLRELLLYGNPTPEDVGIAKSVTDQPSYFYQLALLEGDDLNLVRVPSKIVQINGTVNGWIGKRHYGNGNHRPTGLFAAPGEIVTVTVPEDLVNKVSFNIGHHHYYFKMGLMKKAKQKIASPFGGLIVLILNDAASTTRKGMFDVTVENALEAPRFVFGKNTNEDWNRMKHSAVPWTVLTVPGQMTIYIETLKIKSVTNIIGILSYVKETMDIYDELIGIPVGLQPGEEQLKYDPTIGNGKRWVIKVAGVALCIGAGENIVGANWIHEFIDNFKSPIVFHELGHGGCFPDLPRASGQFNAELVMRYIEIKRGLKNWDSWSTPWSVLKYMVGFKIFSKGKPCYEADSAKKLPTGISYKVDDFENCWTVIYRFPFFEFGWDKLQQVFNLNADKEKYSSIKYVSAQIKSERLAELYCKATGHNMLPFYNFFNINVSASAAPSCQGQPMPKILTDYMKVANCLANKDIRDLDCAKMPEFQEMSKTDKGWCLISGACQRNPDGENKPTTFDNNFDLFGANKTRDTEKGCHDRAKEFFVRCGNNENQPITATYRLKNGRSTNTTVPLFPLPAGNCYFNHPGPTPHYVSYTNTLDAAECNKKCKDKNYSYFGLKSHRECWCGNKGLSPAWKVEMTKCDKMCIPNPSLRCGGADSVNAWKVCTEENCNFSYE